MTTKKSATNGHASADTAKNGAATAVISAPAETDEAAYQAAVEMGRTVVAGLSAKQWDIGDLAAEVEKAYGENRLAQYALDINYPGAVCTMGRCRDVCRAWPKNRARPRYFSSAKILAIHPDRFAIVERNPDISKAEASELMREWRAAQNGAASQEADDDLEETDDDTETTAISTPAKAKGKKKPTSEERADFNESKRQLRTQVQQANDMIGVAEVRKKCPPEQRRNLGRAAAAVPESLKTMQKAGEDWLEYVKFLKKAAAEAKKAAESNIRRSPKSTSSNLAQVSA